MHWMKVLLDTHGTHESTVARGAQWTTHATWEQSVGGIC
jgi:hypothetical protein